MAGLYEKLKAESPVPLVEGGKEHPLRAVGGAYFPKGAPWLMRKLMKEDLPKDPFIFTQGPETRVQMKGLLSGNVDASPEAVLAHELGHAKDRTEGGLPGRVLQSGLARGGGQFVGNMAGMLGGAYLGRALLNKGGLSSVAALPAAAAVGAAGGVLGNVPTLMSEGRATKEGLEKLRAAGATEEAMGQYEKELASALGSYKRGALVSGLTMGTMAPVLAKFGESKPSGFYKGEPVSPSTVKFKTEFQGIPINVDRPKGFIMRGTDAKGTDWARRYKYDYGFIPKTLGGDGDGLDVFIGPDKKTEYAYWAIQRKDDGSFDEYKVFLGFPDRDAAISAYRQHIPKKYFKGIITMKLEMMKAMLGKVNPDEQMKRASALSMLDELGWILGTSA